MAARGPLPEGFRLAADPGTRRVDGGRVLVGGSPLRLLRLSASGAEVVDAWWSGDPVGPVPAEQRLARRLLDAGMAHPRPPGPGGGGTRRPGPPDGRDQGVTLVVPAHGRPDGLARVVSALAPVVAEVVVVDDASPDPAAIRAAAGAARIVARERQGGPGAARNSGWREARTGAVLFVDTDCSDPLPSPAAWLRGLTAHLADPAVAAVAPRVTADPARAPARLAAYDTVRSPLDLGPMEAAVRPRSRVPFVPAAALLVRRTALEETGGFDESLQVGEDVDLVWRLAGAGWTVRYEPAVSLAHEVRPDLVAWARQRFTYGTSAAALERRHPGAAAPVVVSPWTALAWGAVGAGHPAVGAAVAAVTTGLLAPRLDQLEHPWAEAARLAGRGHLLGGRQLAEAARRVWWPVVAAAAVKTRRGRRLAAALAVVPPLVELVGGRGPGARNADRGPDARNADRGPDARNAGTPGGIDPVSWVALRLVDDLAYGAGVWAGAARGRSARALLPDLTAWPGRRPAVETPAPTTDQP